jgi:hypothetical protein
MIIRRLIVLLLLLMLLLLLKNLIQKQNSCIWKCGGLLMMTSCLLIRLCWKRYIWFLFCSYFILLNEISLPWTRINDFLMICLWLFIMLLLVRRYLICMLLLRMRWEASDVSVYNIIVSNITVDYILALHCVSIEMIPNRRPIITHSRCGHCWIPEVNRKLLLLIMKL